jgi:hypothetical protein
MPARKLPSGDWRRRWAKPLVAPAADGDGDDFRKHLEAVFDPGFAVWRSLAYPNI